MSGSPNTRKREERIAKAIAKERKRLAKPTGRGKNKIVRGHDGYVRVVGHRYNRQARRSGGMGIKGFFVPALYRRARGVARIG